MFRETGIMKWQVKNLPHLPRQFHLAANLVGQAADRFLVSGGQRLAPFGHEVGRLAHVQEQRLHKPRYVRSSERTEKP